MCVGGCVCVWMGGYACECVVGGGAVIVCV